LEIILNVSEVVSVMSVVTGHSLEASGKKRLLLRDLLKSLGNIVRESFKFVSNIWKSSLYAVSILLSLIKMASPLLSVGSNLTHSELVGDSLNLKLPLLSAD
jgi:hypothetical protein